MGPCVAIQTSARVAASAMCGLLGLAGGLQVVVKLAKRGESGVGDMAVGELGKPGVANPGTSGDFGPIASAALQQGFDLGVKLIWHSSRIAKLCYSNKLYLSNTLLS